MIYLGFLGLFFPTEKKKTGAVCAQCVPLSRKCPRKKMERVQLTLLEVKKRKRAFRFGNNPSLSPLSYFARMNVIPQLFQLRSGFPSPDGRPLLSEMNVLCIGFNQNSLTLRSACLVSHISIIGVL